MNSEKVAADMGGDDEFRRLFEESLRSVKPGEVVTGRVVLVTRDLVTVDIGDSIHISSVKLPNGVEPTITDRDFTIATLAGSASARSDADGEDGEAGEEAPAAAPDAEENKDE